MSSERQTVPETRLRTQGRCRVTGSERRPWRKAVNMAGAGADDNLMRFAANTPLPAFCFRPVAVMSLTNTQWGLGVKGWGREG